KRTGAAVLAADAAQQQGVQLLKSKIPALQFSRDPLLGTPRFISTSAGFLSSPAAVGNSSQGSTSLIGGSGDPHLPVKTFLSENAALFGYGAEVLASARLKQDYVTAHNGLRTVIWEQTVDDVAVFDGLLVSHITRNGELVNVSSR